MAYQTKIFTASAPSPIQSISRDVCECLVCPQRRKPFDLMQQISSVSPNSVSVYFLKNLFLSVVVCFCLFLFVSVLLCLFLSVVVLFCPVFSVSDRLC